MEIERKNARLKKSTTFTVLKRLCDKGIFKNENGIVSSVLSRDEFYSHQSRQFVKETLDGSLPAFLSAFTSKQKLSKEEIKHLRKMIEEYGECSRRVDINRQYCI